MDYYTCSQKKKNSVFLVPSGQNCCMYPIIPFTTHKIPWKTFKIRYQISNPMNFRKTPRKSQGKSHQHPTFVDFRWSFYVLARHGQDPTTRWRGRSYFKWASELGRELGGEKSREKKSTSDDKRTWISAFFKFYKRILNFAEKKPPVIKVTGNPSTNRCLDWNIIYDGFPVTCYHVWLLDGCQNVTARKDWW